jgi:hypothetical protein
MYGAQIGWSFGLRRIRFIKIVQIGELISLGFTESFFEQYSELRFARRY